MSFFSNQKSLQYLWQISYRRNPLKTPLLQWKCPQKLVKTQGCINLVLKLTLNQIVGWQLLNCLRVLISTNNQLVARALSEASVPSTLAKSLYLFYDLPEVTRLHRCRLNQEFRIRTLIYSHLHYQMMIRWSQILISCAVAGCPMYLWSLCHRWLAGAIAWRKCAAETICPC